LKNYAILGAGGFIGYRLTEYLHLNSIAAPRPIVRSFRSMARVSRFHLDVRLANATDVTSLSDALNGCDVAFHCVVGNRDTILNSVDAAYAACRQAGVRRLVYLSSAVVMGSSPEPGTDENTPLKENQRFEYNVSKVMAERRLRKLMGDGAVECVLLRPCIVFGPRSTYWSAQLASDLLAGKAYLINGGKGICNTIYIDNLVELMVLCATHPAATGNTYIAKDAERVTWRELYGSVAQAIGVDEASILNLDLDIAAGRSTLAKSWRGVARVVWRNRLVRAAKELVRSEATVGLAIQLRAKLLTPSPTNDVKAESPYSLDPELVTLQMCRYELPTRKAAAELNFAPKVSFPEGARRTQEWLRFASGGSDKIVES